MRAVIQRVTGASVTVSGAEVSAIGKGFLVLVGVGHDDSEDDAVALASKIARLRVFPDDAGRMNLSLGEVGGSVLVVSQFTLLGDLRKGRRPSFVAAASPEVASPLVDRVAAELADRGIDTRTGVFGAMMRVRLENDGPVTLVVDTADGSIM